MSTETTPDLNLRLSDFEYAVPPELIAQTPLAPRDHSRLMVLKRDDASIQHRRFHEIGEYLRAGDVLVLNTTRVFPARLRGNKRSGGKAELLLLRPVDIQMPDGPPSAQTAVRWVALVRGAAAAGSELLFPEGMTSVLEQRLENGEWIVRFSRPARPYLEEFGEMPLPPYIKRSKRDDADQRTYQTVFAGSEGSVAAPTAGFHFTPELLERLRSRGVEIVDIRLHVGWGTFRPVRDEDVTRHRMLAESYEVSEAAGSRLNAAKREGRRIIAVGTTAVRTLESISFLEEPYFRAGAGETDIFIYPGYRFKGVDALITNFHLPHSTPLLLACAFYSAKQHAVTDPFSLRPAYQAAVQEGYRFYSYGDAMFIE